MTDIPIGTRVEKVTVYRITRVTRTGLCARFHVLKRRVAKARPGPRVLHMGPVMIRNKSIRKVSDE